MDAHQHKQWDMTAVDDVIERALYNHPRLFRHRTDVLAHMFLTPGTGYEWTDGYLYSDDAYQDGDLTDEQVKREYSSLRIPDDLPDDLKEDMRAIEADMRADTDARNAELLALRQRATELARTPGDPSRLLIHHDTYDCRAYNPPTNIRPDWEAARQEVLAVAEPLWAEGVHILVPALVSDDLEAHIAYDAASPRPRLTSQATANLRAQFEAAKANPDAYRDRFGW